MNNSIKIILDNTTNKAMREGIERAVITLNNLKALKNSKWYAHEVNFKLQSIIENDHSVTLQELLKYFVYLFDKEESEGIDIIKYQSNIDLLNRICDQCDIIIKDCNARRNKTSFSIKSFYSEIIVTLIIGAFIVGAVFLATNR